MSAKRSSPSSAIRHPRPARCYPRSAPRSCASMSRSGVVEEFAVNRGPSKGRPHGSAQGASSGRWRCASIPPGPRSTSWISGSSRSMEIVSRHTRDRRALAHYTGSAAARRRAEGEPGDLRPVGLLALASGHELRLGAPRRADGRPGGLSPRPYAASECSCGTATHATQRARGTRAALNDKPLPGFLIRLQVRNGLGAMPEFGSDRDRGCRARRFDCLSQRLRRQR